MEDQIKNLIAESAKSNVMGSFTIPLHRHNGSDSPQIYVTDIIIPIGTGIPFTNGQLGYNMFISNNNDLVLQPSTDFFTKGVSSNLIIGNYNSTRNGFTTIDFNIAGTTVQNPNFTITTSDLTSLDTSTLSVAPDLIFAEVLTHGTGNSSTSELSYNGQEWTSNGDFAIKLPDTTLPSPVAGMIAFHSGQFHYCKVTGTWLTF